jgi:hypothetical protein
VAGADEDGRVARVRIDDRPAVARRGVMLDVSRCRIPKMDEFARVIGTLAGLKCNHLQLYTEHTFAYAGHEAAWRGWSPITPDEARTLDAACRARGIELAANQNCFGHLKEWLEQPAYAGLAETHGEWMFDVWPRRGPFSLCPTDARSLALVEDWLGQLAGCFTSGLVNIGCDETYDIAYGRSADAVRDRGRGAVYAEFVSKVARAAGRLGKRAMFWADVALSEPACLAMLPDDLVALAWGYEPDADWEGWLSALRGRDVWLCPGTSSWLSLTGRTSERRANMDGAVRAAASHGSAGVLVCDWGDRGHWQPWPIALHALGDGLASAWEGAGGGGGARARASSTLLLGDSSGRAGAWLEALGDADLALREVCLPLSRPGVEGRLRNQSALYADLFKGWEEAREVGGVERWRGARERVGVLGGSRPRSGDAQIEAELAWAAAAATLAAERACLRRERGGGAATSRDALRARWADLEARFAELWRARSREGGLARSREFFASVGW